MTGPRSLQQYARVMDSIPPVTIWPVDTLPVETYRAPEAEWQAAMAEKYGADWEQNDV